VFLGGDNQHCKLGIGNNSNRAGFWKLDSSFLFSSISLFDDSTVLVTKDGDLLLLGHIGGNTITRKRNPLTRREKLHSVCHVSGYRASMVVSTNDGEIYLYVANTEGKVLLGNSDRDYDALVSCRADATLVCLSEKKTSKVTAHFHLLLMTMRRTELHDIDLVVQ
jgi:alpha-tubulin suppressor-like RCC1 family protein